jgi:putative NADPH-quinone reductase
VLAQQHKVARADGLAFIAPICFGGFPAILQGWLDRVWTLDFAFGLTCAGWHGDINGQIPLLHHRRALIMTPTLFGKNAYDDGIRDAIGTVIDDWAFRFPGIADVEHVYFYAATSATSDLARQYFRQAYQLGRDFERPTTAAAHSAPAALPASPGEPQAFDPGFCGYGGAGPRGGSVCSLALVSCRVLRASGRAGHRGAQRPRSGAAGAFDAAVRERIMPGGAGSPWWRCGMRFSGSGWFIILLVTGLFSFGFIAMIIYLCAEPDDAPRGSVEPAPARRPAGTCAAAAHRRCSTVTTVTRPGAG